MDYIIDTFINTLSWTMIILILIRGSVNAFLPSFQDRHWFYKVKGITDFIILPLKKVIPSFEKLDLSYLVAVILIRTLTKILMWLF